MGSPWRLPGTGYTPGSPTALPGWTTTARCPSSTAPSSGCKSITCPATGTPQPVWLWWSAAGALPADVDRCWQAFLRRFDLEHTFRLFKQVLGWTAPKIRDPAAADRWTWLIITCHAQLRLARSLARDLRLPWERPAPPGRLTPARVRRGFRNIRATMPCPAGAQNPANPAPAGHPDPRTATPHPRHDVGKTTKRKRTLKARRERAG
jgi:hypothetical protein